MPKRPTQIFDSIGRIKPNLPDGLKGPIFDGAAFDEHIRQYGLRWKHEKAALCPNVMDIDAQDHDPNCANCDRGYLFFGDKVPIGAFYQNKLEKMYDAQGVWDIGQAVVTFQSYLDGPDGEPSQGSMVDFQVGDRLTCLDYTFTWQELIENSPGGIDRLRYPACTVEFVADKNMTYLEGVHFKITKEGFIEWVSAKRPKFRQDINRGGVYTVVYTAQPVFFVVQLLHEIRATIGTDKRNGNEIKAIRLPQQVLIRRDYLFQHPGDTQGQKDVLSPRTTTFPPG